MADRDAYIADPAFTDVPLETLLSPEYAASRRAPMTARAFTGLPEPGTVKGRQAPGDAGQRDVPGTRRTLDARLAFGQDTSQLVVVDGSGSAVVITPSDFPQTPMIPGTGLNLGNQMNQFRLDPDHVGSLQPGKRPRITPHALILFKNDRFFMALSTPGGDMQAQALVQVLLNMHLFGMDVQEAVNAPRFYSISAPSSFAPHESFPGHIRLEGDLYARTAEGLAALGYTPEEDPVWDKDFGAVGAIVRSDDGKLYTAADPREETAALGR